MSVQVAWVCPWEKLVIGEGIVQIPERLENMATAYFHRDGAIETSPVCALNAAICSVAVWYTINP